MKTSLQLSTVIIIAILAFGTSGCKKVYDFIGKNPDLKYCNIKTIYSHSSKYDFDTALFKYNSLGNPISITIGIPRTGFPNRIFLYDQHNRLTDYIGVYSGNNSFEYWHKYFYRSDKIVLDSMYVFGDIIDNKPVNYYFFRTITYDYDYKNRISKMVYVEQDGRTSEHDFSYDSKGNLIVPDYMHYKYDDKINFRQTNKIWMFLEQDYSVNNPIKAEKYNRYGLPLTGNLLDFLDIHVDEIEYACK